MASVNASSCDRTTSTISIFSLTSVHLVQKSLWLSLTEIIIQFCSRHVPMVRNSNIYLNTLETNRLTSNGSLKLLISGIFLIMKCCNLALLLTLSFNELLHYLGLRVY